ncbi:MAG: spore germination protein GerW family protein [Clostridia bacterium]|nr:spore germination protein GerW family protein [Clostridia bacterium]
MSPVETILQTTMHEIQNIVDVNTIVGDPIYGEGGAVVLPVSKVSLGFLTGGGDFPTQTVTNGNKSAESLKDYPFLGASLVGVTITPKAFLCMRSGSTTLLCADCDNAVDRLVQMIPGVIEEAKHVVQACKAQESADEQSSHKGSCDS